MKIGLKREINTILMLFIIGGEEEPNAETLVKKGKAHIKRTIPNGRKILWVKSIFSL